MSEPTTTQTDETPATRVVLAEDSVLLRDGIARLAVDGSAAVADDVAAHCATLGAKVTVSLPDGTTLHGTAARLDDDGRLVVSADGVEAVVSAGDVVHVR